MARARFVHSIQDRAGNAVQNARINFYDPATGLLATDVFAADVGGSAITFLLTNNQGEITGYKATAGKLELEITDNSDTAHYSGQSGVKTWTPYREIIDVLPDPSDFSATPGADKVVRAGADGKIAVGWEHRAQISDGGLWYSPNGNDSNDGLSEGAAKLTPQACINALPAGGGKVTQLHGLITSGVITPVSGLHLAGLGWGSILKLANGTNPVHFIGGPSSTAVDDVIIENLQVDGNKANNTSGRAILLYGKNITVQKCYVHDTANSCIQTSADDARKTGGAGKHRILNNYCLNPALSGNFWGAIANTGGDGIIMAGNICESTDGFMAYAIDVEPNATWVTTGVLIANNICRGGQLVVTAEVGTVTDALLVGNHVKAAPGAGTPAGMRVQSVGGRVLINDNDIQGPATFSPALALTSLVDPQVIGNRLSGMGVAQNISPNNVGMLLTSLAGGFIDANFITAAAATHATEIAGIKEVTPVGGTQFGINGFRNITVKGKTTQQAANPDTSGATLGALETEVNELKATIRAYGLIP